MLQAASMRVMPEQVIRRKETEEDRKVERQKMRVSPNTLEWYAVALLGLLCVGCCTVP